jgi:exopolyphosphatase/guanosine-5'-triphosphate,3'-diphosphate pyrophosphatase
MRIASIDIGTNTFRILIGELTNNQLRKLYIDRVITRLGGGFVKEEKLITRDATRRALRTLREFAEMFKRYNVEKVRAIGTSVIRESINSTQFMEEVRKETGIEIEIISGEEEAKLTVCGVVSSVSVASPHCVIFDIGGGSTEYMLVEEHAVKGLTSTSLGVVHLTESFLKNHMSSESDIRMLSEEIESVLSSELSFIPAVDYKNLTLVGTAGTPTTLASIVLGLEKYNAELVNGFVLNRDEVLRIFKTLTSLPIQERLKIKGLEKGREDVIIPGILIVLKTMERFSKDEVLVSDGGLLEGVAYSIIP